MDRNIWVGFKGKRNAEKKKAQKSARAAQDITNNGSLRLNSLDSGRFVVSNTNRRQISGVDVRKKELQTANQESWSIMKLGEGAWTGVPIQGAPGRELEREDGDVCVDVGGRENLVAVELRLRLR